MEENKRLSNLLQSRILSVSSSSCLLRRLASLIFSSFWNPFLQTNQAKHQSITLYMLPFLHRSSSRTRKFFFSSTLQVNNRVSKLVPHYRNRSNQTEIWRTCVGDTSKQATSKLNRSKKPNGASLLQCAEDVADLPVDLGQLLVDRRQIHVLLPLRVRATETPRGKAKSERKEG